MFLNNFFYKKRNSYVKPCVSVLPFVQVLPHCRPCCNHRPCCHLGKREWGRARAGSRPHAKIRVCIVVSEKWKKRRSVLSPFIYSCNPSCQFQASVLPVSGDHCLLPPPPPDAPVPPWVGQALTSTHEGGGEEEGGLPSSRGGGGGDEAGGGIRRQGGALLLWQENG